MTTQHQTARGILSRVIHNAPLGALSIGGALLLILVLAACEQSPPDTPPPPSVTLFSKEDVRKIGYANGYPLNGRYTLANDLTLDAWTPLSFAFKGSFDGAGHTVTITNGKGGLFAELTGATVRNLNVDVTATRTGTNTVHAGGIAGLAERSTIENCTATVNLTVTGGGHNTTTGGIVGFMLDNSVIRGCAASGTITLTGSSNAAGDAGRLMVYAGGIAGYSGTGTAGTGASGCLITRSQWTSGTIKATSPFPYAGGVTGYNYTGARITQCWAAGTVEAESSDSGATLPYAGGVSGYNSGFVSGTAIAATIENCYSTATVSAVSTSQAALAGGIAGANAKHALIANCYATGAITATVNGSGTDNLGGSIGPMLAASAGGIAGAQYFHEPNSAAPDATIRASAALSPSLTGTDTGSGATMNIHRIAGTGTDSIGTYTNNRASSTMTLTPTPTGSQGSDTKDGANTDAKPAQTVYQDMGWNFTSVWQWGSNGYPALR